jgi:hypothetical protein
LTRRLLVLVVVVVLVLVPQRSSELLRLKRGYLPRRLHARVQVPLGRARWWWRQQLLLLLQREGQRVSRNSGMKQGLQEQTYYE